MTGWTDESLMRAVDGELTPDEFARLETDRAADPALAGRYEAMIRMNRRVRAAYPAAVDPRDADLARMIAGAGVKAPGVKAGALGWGERVKAAFVPRRVAAWGALAAACFVAGVLVSDLRGAGSSGATFALAEGGVIADAGLVQVLDRRLAREGLDGDGRSVGLTFRDGDGRWCRTFRADEAGVAGLACRADDGWTLEALAAANGAGAEIRMAAADTPAPVLAAVDALIAGETLDAEGEAAARDGGWR